MSTASNNINAVKQAIIDHGAVGASIYMDSSDGYTFADGTKRAYNYAYNCLYGTNSSTNHDILLVGWDDNFAVSNFSSYIRPDKSGAWLVRNSWGYDEYGPNGYFWISYYDTSLACISGTAYDAINDTSEIADYCYSFDKTPLYNVTTSWIQPTITGQAVVTQTYHLDGNEKINAIGVETATDGLTISVSVRIDGTEVAKGSRSAPNAGFYRVRLDNPYVLTSATDVDVVVTHKGKSDQEILVPYECNFTRDYGDAITYIGHVDSGGFDVNGTHVDGDVRLKVYTKKYASSGFVEVTAVTLDKTSLTGLETGDEQQLTATVLPANATNKRINWSSSNPSVATVTNTGLVAAESQSGTAVIYATSSNGIVASCTVEVNHKDLPITGLTIVDGSGKAFPGKTLTINEQNAGSFKLGDTLSLNIAYTPKHTTQPDVNWYSSKWDVAEVENTYAHGGCSLKILESGMVVITARSSQNSSIEDSLKIIIDLPIHVESVSIYEDDINIYEDEWYPLYATVKPGNADNKELTWTSSNPAVATVDEDGDVTGVKDGTCVITAKAKDNGKSDSVKVTVYTRDPVEAFVYRMYRVCLQREPDEAGFNAWVDALKAGSLTGSQLAYSFLYSSEMIARNLSNGDYVERVYEATMGRASDAAGKAAWVKVLNEGLSRKAVISGFVKSQEFSFLCYYYDIPQGDYVSDEPRDINDGATAYVARLYTKMLGRDFDPDGLNAWCAEILRNPTKKTLLQVALNGFMHSPEFESKGLSDIDFVKVLYPTFLGREADGAGLKAWVQALQTGSTRDAVAAGFAFSPEFASIMAQYGF